jgi:hypothetical protein
MPGEEAVDGLALNVHIAELTELLESPFQGFTQVGQGIAGEDLLDEHELGQQTPDRDAQLVDGFFGAML